MSPYAASTVYTSTGTFKGWQMGIEVDTITVVDSEKTPEARRPHSADDSEPCSGSSCSPIIIDVSGEGYRLTSTADGVAFDLRDEGRTRQTSWTARGAENAFLALDRNRNRRIDSGAELFGQATRLQSGARAEHGFAALADLDANDDGVIDARDPVWSALLLWTDRDHDGLSGVGELQRIADSGVTALSTHYQTIGKKDEWGNLFRYQSSIGAASRDRKYYDVLLQLER